MKTSVLADCVITHHLKSATLIMTRPPSAERSRN
jgi:hypothetical protein